MADIFDLETRSRIMASVKSKGTKPEWAIRSALHRLGFRFRVHDRRLPGAPDLTLRKHRAVIFVDGCFWHQHPGCRHATKPRTRTEYWGPKLAANVDRDRLNREKLAELGWRVLVVWECGILYEYGRVLDDLVEGLLDHTCEFLELPSVPPKPKK